MATPSPSYVIAPEGYRPSDPNPFEPDGAYGDRWSVFWMIAEWTPPTIPSESARRVYALSITRTSPRLKEYLADFIRYEQAHGRCVIVSAPAGVAVDALVQQALSETPAPGEVRESDPRYVVHSTSREAGLKILRDGELRSLQILLGEGTISGNRLGFHGIGEPPDYATHVNFATWVSVWAEAVTSSNQYGRFVTWDEPYTPGYRFYFDHHAMIRAGVTVRAGGPVIKAADRLSLKPFMVRGISCDDVAQQVARSQWTPRKFTAAANRIFEGSL